MTNRLAGKKAVVTGGSRGIGAGIARRLAHDGADVVITFANNRTAADGVVAEIAAAGRTGHAIQADGSDPAAVRAAIDEAGTKLGGIDILVHNAGTAEFGAIGEASEESYRKQFGLNVDGVFFGTTAAVPHLRDGGRIIIIGSINAHKAFPGTSIYGATKAAVAGFARGWARDLGGRGITVNVIQPGPIETDLNPKDSDFAKVLTPMTALGRYGTTAEIGALAAFLASDEAAYITGATIDIDGGLTV